MPNNVEIYLEQIENYPTITDKEEKELGQLIKDGDKKAIHRIIEGNLRFVVYVVVNNYKYCREEVFFDLIQQGNLGLCEAAEKFDYKRGCRFISYAVFYIKSYINNYLNSVLPFIRVTSNNLATRNKIMKYLNKTNFDYEKKNIAEMFNIKEDKVEDIIRCREPISLNTPVCCDDEAEIEDLVGCDSDIEDKFYCKEMMQKVIDLIHKFFDERTIDILECRYGLNGSPPLTLQKISKKLKISRERVRQIQEKAIKILKRKVKFMALDGF